MEKKNILKVNYKGKETPNTKWNCGKRRYRRRRSRNRQE
jgi:hypothetical protein